MKDWNEVDATEVVVPKAIIPPLMERSSPPYSPLTARRVATLEREAPRIIDLGQQAGTQVTYLGIAPMFDNAMVLAGDKTDWVIGPVGEGEAPVVPREQRDALARLEAAGANFPVIYSAHEIPKGNFPGSPDAPTGMVTTVAAGHAIELVGPPPVNAGTVELAERMSNRAKRVFRAVGTAAGAVVAAPLMLVGAAAGALATLDPIILGVIPAGPSRAGEPAAWYVLAKWDW